MGRLLRATSRDVAKLAGVSHAIVSLVLNNFSGFNISKATHQRVLKAAHDLNYHPDAVERQFTSGKPNTFGLIIRQSPAQVFADAFLPQVLLGVEQVANDEGFYVLVRAIAPGKNSTDYGGLVRENHVNGILISGPLKDDRDILNLRKESVPMVLMGQLPGSDIPYVDIDAIGAAKASVQHLINLGHRKIAMITNASLAYVSAQQRHDGYKQAILENGLTPKPDYIIEGNYTPKSGYEAMLKLINLPERPSAVFIASDVVAMGAFRAVKEVGLRIPEDLAIVGFDDIPQAEYFDPPLTTVRFPAYILGLAAADRLIRTIQGEKLEETGVLLNSEIIIRQSSR